MTTTRLYVIALFFLFIACEKKAGNEQGTVEYEPVVDDITALNAGVDTYGKITNENGLAVEGVVVSDGLVCVQTDEKGIYQFKRHEDAQFVFYTLPSGYDVATESGGVNVPLFYKRITVLPNARVRNDFQIKKSSSSHSEFALVAIGDPQPANNNEVNRFRNETIPDIVTTLSALGKPAVGIALGDIVADRQELLLPMKALLGSTDMPVYSTIGNHDKFEQTAAGIKNGNTFSNHYGPLNYSFNVGDVHFICLDNVDFTSNSSYRGYFSNQQMDWVERNLSFVPNDKMVIVFYHIPLRASNVNNKNRLLNLLKDYKEVHLMSGHTHYNQNYIHTNPVQIYEHIHGATCGAWWRSVINGDGTPNGYAVYNISGSTIKDWYYKSVNYDKDFQMRLHRGNASFGGAYGDFAYGLGANVLIANVWNADANWTIEVYENGLKGGNMTLSTLNRDAWSMGYHIGVLNRNPDNYSTVTTHLYRYTIQNTSADIKVVAKDPFGNVYEENTITTDMTAAVSYQ